MLSHKERQVSTRQGLQRTFESGMHRDHQRYPGLLLRHGDLVAPDVLPTHVDHIAAPLRGVEHQRQSRTRLGTNRMARLELSDLLLGPEVKAIGVLAILFQADSRVCRDHLLIDRIGQHHPEHLQQMIGCLGSRGLRCDDGLDVIAAETFERLGAMLSPESLDDVPALRLGARLEVGKVGGAIVGNNQRVERARLDALGTDVARRRTPSSAAACWRMKSSDHGVPFR
jgi:hypothetical protein